MLQAIRECCRLGEMLVASPNHEILNESYMRSPAHATLEKDPCASMFRSRRFFRRKYN